MKVVIYGIVWLVKETTEGLVAVSGAQEGGVWSGTEGELTARARSNLVEL